MSTRVKFIGNDEPCIQYMVKDNTPVMEYSEPLNKYCEHIEIEVLGLVARELLTETNCDLNVNAIDVAIYLNQ